MEIPPPPEQATRWRWRLLGVLGAIAVIAALTVTAYRLGQEGPSGFVEMPVTGNSGAPTSGAPAELDPLTELYNELTAEAVNEPDSEALVEAAMEAMLEELDDPYARYYDAADYAAFSEELDGTYSGVGMELQETGEGLFVVTVFPGTPAEAAGVEAGDQVIGVDGEDVRDEPIEAVVREVRGEEGTDVELEVERDGETLELSITRASIDIPRLDAEMLDDGLGYVRLFQFTGGAGDELLEAVGELVDEGAEGIVLDLRGNPGGLLSEAVRVASAFLSDEVVVRVVERAGEEEALESAGEAFDEIPLVVLVNEGTASASEIVAAAVQAAGRGEVIGEPTFGKGTVQTIKSLPGERGVKFTTAEYLTPAGDSIEDVGVKPDREVAGEEEQLQAAQEFLRSHLAGVAR